MASLVDLCSKLVRSFKPYYEPRELKFFTDNYTTPIQATVVVVTLLMAWSSNTWLKGRRLPMLVLGGIMRGTVCIVLGAMLVFSEYKAFKWFLYYQTGGEQASNR
ncbi:hypothetical protein BDZ45DRAFT_168442 [Acephala macrosclerotiorum]|nr:hypothetical protein BDZ45DRAFT_168442 [Acephala macrosclerotiorum]